MGLVGLVIKKQFPFQHANDQSYLETQCKYFDSASIKDRKFYVPEEAACFINSNLPQYRLDQIYETVNLAANFEREKGLTSVVVPKAIERVKEYVAHNSDEYIQYVHEKNKSALTKEQIDEILDAEIDYAKFIGITD